MTRSNFRPLFWSIATDQKLIGALGLIEVVMMIGYKKSDQYFMHSNSFFGSHEHGTSWSMEMNGLSIMPEPPGRYSLTLA